MFPELTTAQIEHVADALTAAVGRPARSRRRDLVAVKFAGAKNVG